MATARIEMDLNSQPVISGSTFTNNNVNGVIVDGGTLPRAPRPGATPMQFTVFNGT